jgi:hypothetical protein
MADTFAATVSDWCHGVEGAVEDIVKESVQELVSIVRTPRKQGGRMRIDTGFLRASLMASTSQMPSINPAANPPADAKPNSVPFNAGPIELVILGSEVGDTIYIGYTAAYAAHREYGANGQEGDAFVRTAAQRWPAIVAGKEAELRARLGL